MKVISVLHCWDVHFLSSRNRELELELCGLDSCAGIPEGQHALRQRGQLDLYGEVADLRDTPLRASIRAGITSRRAAWSL